MPIVSFLLNNWRILAAIGLIYAGWYSHAVWDGYHAEKLENKAIVNLGKGEANIVTFNQKFNKEKSFVKDDCINKPIPPNLLSLLH